jgi:replicative DNA helicase
VDGRDNTRPGLSDLRDSGNLEQDADVVCFVYREAYYLERLRHDPGTDAEVRRQIELDACRNTLDLMVAKNRNGATNNITLFTDMSCNAVRDLA